MEITKEKLLSIIEEAAKDLPTFIEKVSPEYFKIDSGDNIVLFTNRRGAEELEKAIKNSNYTIE